METLMHPLARFYYATVSSARRPFRTGRNAVVITWERPRDHRLPPRHAPRTKTAIPWSFALALLSPGLVVCQGVSGAVITRHEVITGRVTTSSGTPISQAEVIATRAPDRLSRTTRTDPTGRYSIDFTAGTGDYLVYISTPRYEIVRKRLTRPRIATPADTLFVFDTSLAPSARDANLLPTVNIARERPRIERKSEPGPGVGGADEALPGLNGAVPPGLAGDLAALAATTPGVLPVPGGGFSVLGLKPSDNASTLNGFAFQGTDIPRDARTTTRVVTSAFDPAIGWFSGAQVATTLEPGFPFSSRRSHATIDARALQVPDNTQRDGGRFTRVQGSLGGDGAITNDDRYLYSYGVQAGRRLDPISSLSDDFSAVPQYSGIPLDSIRRLRLLLQERGIPLVPRGAPVSQTTDNFSFIGRFDHAPYDWKTFTPAKTVWGVLAYAKLAQSEATNVQPTTTTAFGGSDKQRSGMLQALYSSYGSAGRLTDARSAISFSRQSSQPYFRLPAGSVLLSSPDSVGGTDAALFRFGATPQLGGSIDNWTWETVGNRQFFADPSARHRVKISVDGRLDALSQHITDNRFGTFTYQSIGDLAANQPSSFTRATGSGSTYGNVGNAFLAVGDYWRVSSRLKLLYGARLDASRFFSHAADVVPISQLFGIRTNSAPNDFAISPRFGFTWVQSPSTGALSVNPVGAFTWGPRQYVSGGIGEFRNIVSPISAEAGSGLVGTPNGARRLTCVGSTVPTPDWSGYLADPSSIPGECVQTGSTQFASDASDARFLDPSFQPSHSLRANLSYGASFSKFAFSTQALYSLALRQASISDLNFSGVPEFTIAEEGNRSVYVPVSAIAPTSGIPAPGASRRFDSFGRVDDVLSDGRSSSRRLSASLSPDLSDLGNWFASVTYTLSSVRQLERGFDAATFGSPAQQEWAPGDFFSRHQYLVQAGYGSDNVAITLFGRIASGMPFTPMVSSDINGDGLANDRAFIFNPQRAPDPVLGTALQQLISNSPDRVRDCLDSQLGRAASRNSCLGPWTASLNAQLAVTGKTLHIGQRVNVVLGLANAVGALDEVLHGSRHLRGWGAPAIPDPVLYNVQGFDPAARRFNYVVNNQFGSTAASNTLLRVPFRVTLDISIDLGKPIGVQQLEKWMSPGRHGRSGPRLTAQEIKQRYAHDVPDPYAEILAQDDSLLLSRDQVSMLRVAEKNYLTQVDAIWSALATYLAGLGEDYDSNIALSRAESATSEVWELSRLDIQRTLPGILNPIQLRLMPVAGLFRARTPILGRTYHF